MPIRFRRRIRILPGLHLNLSKRGLSLSAGARGAHVTVGRQDERTTVGLPGTGLSATHYEPYHRRAAKAAAKPGFLASLIGYAVVALFFAWLFGWL